MNELNLTRRPSAFESIANIAAINHYRGRRCWLNPSRLTDEEILTKIFTEGSQCPTFRCPNNHERGYWKVLNMIADAKDGIKRKEICEHFKLPSFSMQLDNLEYAGLIKLDREYTHKFTVTSFGKAYISAVLCEFNF